MGYDELGSPFSPSTDLQGDPDDGQGDFHRGLQCRPKVGAEQQTECRCDCKLPMKHGSLQCERFAHFQSCTTICQPVWFNTFIVRDAAPRRSARVRASSPGESGEATESPETQKIKAQLQDMSDGPG